MPFSGLEYLGINDTVLLFLTLNATFSPLNILNIETNFFSGINYEHFPAEPSLPGDSNDSVWVLLTDSVINPS